MPILSYNCLNKLNLFPMHLFRFQRPGFYPADQERPRPGYQTMSTIKETLRHSRKGGGGDWDGGKKRRVERFKRYLLRVLRAQRRKGKKKGTKQERAKEWEFVPYPWDYSKYYLTSKETYVRTCTHQISLSPTKSSSPNYLGRQCPSKATWTCKSCAKTLNLWELGLKSSWLTHSHEIHLHICIYIKMYILI